jgi:DNA modification methylase
MDYMKHVKKDSYTMTLTDIPYEVVNRESNGLRRLDKGKRDEKGFDLYIFLRELIRVTSGTIVIFCATEQVSRIREVMVAAGMSTRLGIWHKSNPSPMNGEYLYLSAVECFVYGKKAKATFNAKCKHPVFRYPVQRVKFNMPSTGKPIGLCRELIRDCTNPGDTVFDPCFGSGSSIVAAILEERLAIGCDTDDACYNYTLDSIRLVTNGGD